MDVEKVGPSGETSSSERKGRKSTPDSEDFREKMKTKKVDESEFEGPRKRRYKRPEDEKLPESVPKSKPTESTPFRTQPTINVPSSDQNKAPPVKESTDKPKADDHDKSKDKDKKVHDKKKKKSEEVIVYKKDDKQMMQVSKKEKATTEKIQKKEKVFVKEAYKPQKEEEKKVKETPPPPEKKEKITPPITAEKQDLEKERKKRDQTKIAHEISAVLQEMPQNIAQQTDILTSPLTPYLHPDIIPLFEKMVGTIIQLQAQGITRTQVMLNSPAFASSIFFGSSITLEKYSTAPDSFNIMLKGPQQAVMMFNENLEGLMDAFKRGNFNFKVARLEAEHETLFRRKEKTGDKKEKDSGSKK